MNLSINLSHPILYRIRNCILSLLIIINLTGCGVGLKTLVPPPQRTPIKVDKEGLPKISVNKILSDMLPGQIVGGHFDGFAKMKQFDYYSQGTVEYWAEQKYIEIMYSELNDAGYNVSEYSKVFGETEKYNVRYLLGGTITNLIQQSFGQNAGNFTEVFIEINWELFDRGLNKTIFKFKTHGYGRMNGVTTEATFIAFRNSFRNLLAEPSFVELIRKQELQKVEYDNYTTIEYYDTLTINDANPDSFAKLLDAVFAIKTETGHGSGFIINPNGFAITCYHVIENRNSVDAIFSDGKIIRVNVVSIYPEFDLALLKISGTNYPYLPLSDKSEIQIGKEVFAIGNPISLNLASSISKGVISGIRDINKSKFIQTDAAVNPGNSGGPLTLRNGKVVGVLSYKYAGWGVEGLGFAISIEDVISIMKLQKKP